VRCRYGLLDEMCDRLGGTSARPFPGSEMPPNEVDHLRQVSQACARHLRDSAAGEIVRWTALCWAAADGQPRLVQSSWWSSVMVTSMYSWSPLASFHTALQRTGSFSPSN
jgi:hypothetical protein